MIGKYIQIGLAAGLFFGWAVIAQDGEKKPERRPSAAPPEKVEARTGDIPADELLTKVETFSKSETVSRKYTYYLAKNRMEVKHGAYLEYYENGSKRRQVTYAHGSPHGRQRWWHNNGMLWMDFSCIAGKRNGTYQEYHRTGKKRKTIVYKDGRAVKKKK